ncbi:MAG: tetraacyldisaccharide 4'-kinase [Deltaproteobacteria bacterium]|nr:tetraacyldisaccharide 4'-kinase [Deltaproteobacteria bacterium]
MISRPLPLFAGASLAYGAAVRLREAAFASGFLPVRRASGICVVSVGNLRAGGSGKTPLAMFLAGAIARAGVPTALVTRGYRGSMERTGGVVSRGSGPLAGPEQAGDEAFLAAVRLPGVTVLAGGNRFASAVRAASQGLKVAILDDGFQHRHLHRDLDILLACPQDLDPATRLLPLGPLREPSSAASRAHLVGGLTEDWGQGDPGFLFSLVPECLVDFGWKPHPLDAERGARAFLLSGIARPSRFARTVRDAGFDVAGHAAFPDHHRFTASDLTRVGREARDLCASLVLTTEKDLARGFLHTGGPPLFAMRVSVRLARGSDRLASLLTRAIGDNSPLSFS